MKLDWIARAAPRRLGAATLAASTGGAALLVGAPALAVEPGLVLEALDACRFGDFGCGHGFGCPCHFLPPITTAH